MMFNEAGVRNFHQTPPTDLKHPRFLIWKCSVGCGKKKLLFKFGANRREFGSYWPQECSLKHLSYRSASNLQLEVSAPQLFLCVRRVQMHVCSLFFKLHLHLRFYSCTVFSSFHSGFNSSNLSSDSSSQWFMTVMESKCSCIICIFHCWEYNEWN